MPNGFSFDGDTAAYAALKKAVLQQEAEKKEAERERRRSIGLPVDEKKSFFHKEEDPARKKSLGEKVANFIFNGGRPEKLEEWQEMRGPSKEFR